MEARSGAERLLSPKIRQVSARAILALAAAAMLAVSGCGGSSSDGQTASAPTSRDQQPETGGPASEAPAPGSGSSQSQGPDQSQSSSQNPVPGSDSGSGPDSGASSTEGKHGPKVKIPSGEPEKGVTPKQRAEATVVSIALESPALGPSSSSGAAELPATYTCDGKDTWPELVWRGVPAGTAELALFVMSLKPVEGRLSFNWTVAGLDPSLTGVPTGRLPKGAVVGRNSFGKPGYTICPPKGSSETYIFALYALPNRVNVSKGFDPIALRKQVGQMSGNGGVMAVGYRRG